MNTIKKVYIWAIMAAAAANTECKVVKVLVCRCVGQGSFQQCVVRVNHKMKVMSVGDLCWISLFLSLVFFPQEIFPM